METFLKTAMPEGVFAITSLPYVDQLSATQKLLAMLQGPLADTVTELGLGRQVSRIAEILPGYQAALHGASEPAVTFAPVRDARQRGQRFLRELVAMILGRYNRDEDPAHREARARLLTPLWKQVQAARARCAGVATGTAPSPASPRSPATRSPVSRSRSDHRAAAL